MFSLNEASTLAREPDVAAALDAVDRYLASRSGASAFRQARGKPPPEQERASFHGLVELGLHSAFGPELSGGSGLAESAALLFAERFGWWLAREPFVENVVFPGALVRRVGDAESIAAIADGQAFCVAWQEAPFDLTGRAAPATSLARVGQGWHLRGQKRFVMGAACSEQVLVLARLGDGSVLVRVPSSARGVLRTDKVLADGSFWSEIEFDLDLPESAVRARGAALDEALAQAIALANLALAGVLHGLQSRILTITLEYLRTRVQFGHPIGAFQALQHRAADLYAHAQITRFLLGEAADALRGHADTRTMKVYASRAKARAADSALRIAKEGIQMHGAIGFSDEHDLGLYVKRVLVLSAWLGNAAWHRRHLAASESLEIEALS